ncbi:MAG: GNAT family N-acetyltransferase [Bacteroidetes bacterium]|nr:GNAT family N-acetyltransferase [Bacteroidota bacterium]
MTPRKISLKHLARVIADKTGYHQPQAGNIRVATYHDAPTIKILLEGLGYSATLSLLIDQLEMAFGQNDHKVFVYELNKEVVGFISVHFLPQLAFDGDLALITYLSVEDSIKDRGIAKTLEEYVTSLARARRCNRIQVHCAGHREQACQFFARQGYQEHPRYYDKKLIYVNNK